MTASPQIALASPQNLADIAACLAALPAADLEAATVARTKAVADGLEPLSADLLAWLAAWQGRSPPRLDHPRIIMFAADHGVGKGKNPAKPQVERILEGQAALCQQAEVYDADLRLYELDLSTPTADLTTGAAMGEGECTAAIVYGMMAVEMGVDVIALGSVSGGTQLVAAVLAKLLGHDEAAADWAQAEEAPLRDAAAALHAATAASPLELLRCAGGREIAAMLGVMIAARMARMPVAIEGAGGLIAAALLHRLDPRAVQHCLFVGAPMDCAAKHLAAELNLLAVMGESDDAEAGLAASAMIPMLRFAARQTR